MECALVKFDIKHGFHSTIFTILFTNQQLMRVEQSI